MTSRIQSIAKQLTPVACSAQVAKASEENDILYEVLDGGIAQITLNRPQRLNALTQAMQGHWFDALEKARDDPKVKVIVVVGADNSFCAGADFELLKNIGNDNAVFLKEPRDLSQIQALEIPKPIIAGINGPCAGLGLVLATMCDIRFAVSSAKITTAFAKRGLVAEYGLSYTLPKLVGVSNAFDMLLSARVVTGEEAKEMGLVTKTFKDKAEMMQYMLSYAREMAVWCSPASMSAMKHQLYNDSSKTYKQVAKDALVLMRNSMIHPDSKEGVQSYLDKRKPIFEGLKFGRLEKM